MKKSKLFLLCIFLSFSFVAKAQDSERNMIINDLLFISENFAAPAAKGAAFQGSAGWFISAAPLKPWDFRVSVHANALFIPAEEKVFNVSNEDLETLRIVGAESATVPTAFGGESDVQFEGEYLTIPFRFQAFTGVNMEMIPHAFGQVAIGFPGGSEVTLRYMPEITIDNVNAKTYGAGVKHSISQYFPYNYPHRFQLAAGVAYSKFFVNYNYPAVNIEIATLETIDVNADIFVFEVMGSKLLGAGNFELFGAVGVVNTAFQYELGGDGFALGEINSQLQKLEDSEIQFKGDLGFNIHLGRATISAAATAGSLLNVNVGLHVRI